MQKLLLLILLLHCYGSLLAQNFLVLKKRSKVINTFHPGDDIVFKLKGESHFQKAMITGFSQEKIITHYFDLNLSEIDKIKLPDKKSHLVSLFSKLSITGGVLFITLDQANQVLVMRETFGPSEETLMISGSMIGFGLFLKLFVKRTFKINSYKYRLETTDFNYSR